MAQIYESLKALIAPELSKAASALGEPESKVSNAGSMILAGILAKILRKGNDKSVENTLREAGKANILSNMDTIFGNRCSVEHENLGNRFARLLMGDNSSAFTSEVARESGISQASANKLTNLYSTAVAGFLGQKLVNGNMSMADIIRDLESEKNRFMGLLPTTLRDKAVNNVKYGAQPVKKKSNYSWLIWLLLALALLLLIIFGWRSCRDKDVRDNVNTVRTNTEQTIDRMADTVRNVANRIADDQKEFTLPNGTKIVAYRNTMEEKMIDFLNSNNYKNAKEDKDLSSRWFEFEDIDFARGSATQLDASAEPHLNNMVKILNAYPDAKIKIAGNADASGGEAANMELSKQRANHIRSILVERGIAASRISTEGFGEEKAELPASASAANAAKDRDIAFRFTK